MTWLSTMEHHSILCHFALLSVVYLSGAQGLQLLSISVPHQVGRGQDTQLKCHFVLEGHPLYSVKWFKGSHEFFRYTPNEYPRYKVFPLKELTVDLSKSNETQVVLRNIQHSNNGTYRCEVSAEAPYFETDFKEANMSVIDLPLQGPIVVNVQSSYRPGELVSLNCTSSPSKPLAHLKWYINGLLAADKYVRRYVDGSQQVRERTGKRRDSPPKNRPPGDESDMAFIGLEFAIELRLSVPPTSSNFQVQNVSCLAQVGDIYKSATHANLLVIDRREALTAASSTVRPPAHLAATGTSRKVSPGWCIVLMLTSLLFILHRLNDR